MNFDNPAPQIFEKQNLNEIDLEKRKSLEMDFNVDDQIDNIEVFDILRYLNDPEHPLTLEQLKVINLEDIHVEQNKIDVYFTPTIPHCSMANMIGLMIIVKLKRSLPNTFKFSVKVHPGSHQNEIDLNKQLQDKERVLAAQENNAVLRMVNKGISNTDQIPEYMQIAQI